MSRSRTASSSILRVAVVHDCSPSILRVAVVHDFVNDSILRVAVVVAVVHDLLNPQHGEK